MSPLGDRHPHLRVQALIHQLDSLQNQLSFFGGQIDGLTSRYIDNGDGERSNLRPFKRLIVSALKFTPVDQHFQRFLALNKLGIRKIS